MPQILLRHHWSRELIFFPSAAGRDHVLLPCKKIDKMHTLYSRSFKSKEPHILVKLPLSIPSDGESPRKVVNTTTGFMDQRAQMYELRDTFDNLTLHHNILRT